MRVFSTSPTLGMQPSGSVSDPTNANYGALTVFLEKVTAYTNGAVSFSPNNWSVGKDAYGNAYSVIQQVGIDGDSKDVAYDNGSSLNAVWGFVFNSGVPFGIGFDLMVQFLYDEGGLALAQSLIDKGGLNVKVLPVVASEPQGSGYFKHPIGKAYCNGEADCKSETPMGLEGLCQQLWTWRYLPPAQNVIQGACQKLATERAIPQPWPPDGLKFVNAVGGLSVVGAVQQGAVTAFEYATALDDGDPATGFFPNLPENAVRVAKHQNPGHKGLRFYHTPSWHQPFYIGWLMMNKRTVWDVLSTDVKTAIEQAAKDALLDSFQRSGSVQCDALKRMFEYNNGQVQLDILGNRDLSSGKEVSADLKWSEWPKDALTRLQAATTVYLDQVAASNSDASAVVGAFRTYMGKIKYKWKPNKFEYPDKACPQPMPL
jgi:TRAP-type mannitol/chloroaromatic compound transport system substrate-binding protein